MPKRGGFTVYGEAAGQLLLAKEGKPARTDHDRALRIATFVSMNMGAGCNQEVAVSLIQAVAKDGLRVVADLCTAKTPLPEAADAPSRVPIGQEIAAIKMRSRKGR